MPNKIRTKHFQNECDFTKIKKRFQCEEIVFPAEVGKTKQGFSIQAPCFQSEDVSGVKRV